MYQNIASLYPDRITVRVEKKENVVTRWSDKLYKKAIRLENSQKSKSQNSLDNLKIKKASFQLSRHSKKKIENSISLLHSLATPRTIFPSKNKPIYNFRCSFVTLTLPTSQSHSDLEIKSRSLNQFFTVMRQKFGLKNYVWKAELQKNDSIHFHIVWDIYVHHKAVRYYWNQALEVLGYVTEYHNKFVNMSLKDYAIYRGLDVHKAVSGFQFGVSTEWKSPPTEQVVAVKSSKQLALYLKKYITKSVDESDTSGISRIISFGRVWGRSQSLSVINFVTRYDWDNLYSYVKGLGPVLDNFHVVSYDYCTVYYFNFKTATKKFLRWLSLKMSELGITYGYVAAT